MFTAFVLASGSEGLDECSLRCLEDSTCRSGKGGVGDLVAESAAQEGLSARLDKSGQGEEALGAEGGGLDLEELLLRAANVRAASDECIWTGEDRDRCMGNMVGPWSDCPRHCQRDSAGNDRTGDWRLDLTRPESTGAFR